MDDGREVLINTNTPRTIAGSNRFVTASEVATLKFVRQSTSLPVPRVLAWNTDSANESGSEYIILEKTPGVALDEIWEGLSTLQRADSFCIGPLCNVRSEQSGVESPQDPGTSGPC
ncbi:hypothetical protein BO99DRAFT_437625 [Aspergillus violaceofuscus CBS 115571]|uniref:Altered inheritance of mitochondria protein 9, mitochondrial n=1 Tax=Aspergillus violaceofuscus (strain CBS 115571) TaxID=1450538 RepID=A0A2V5GSA5_ASPV1|nr:hypothetical protein BO99DRAFT_437625 [Aspergillus violaceofuscus CBS 115571]